MEGLRKNPVLKDIFEANMNPSFLQKKIFEAEMNPSLLHKNLLKPQ